MNKVNPEDEGRMFFKNDIIHLQDYTLSQLTTQQYKHSNASFVLYVSVSIVMDVSEQLYN